MKLVLLMEKEMGDKHEGCPESDKTSELFRRRDGHDEQQSNCKISKNSAGIVPRV